MADTRDLPLGESQAGDRHLNFHDVRGNLRADEARLRELLAPDFVEIVASGRRWDLDSVLAMLRQESTDSEVINLTGLTARELAPGVVQVFWESERAGRGARRTSVWCERGRGWQQVFHQGTPLP